MIDKHIFTEDECGGNSTTILNITTRHADQFSLLCEIASSVLQFLVTRPYSQLLLDLGDQMRANSSVCPKEYIRNSAQFVKLCKQ
jgi:hypothetical protein